ncbi:MAG: exodeoxyribonuclease VII small subunit [Pseudanabaena sp.]|nr:MAG: exodeoxyribonuclease VII small subunit [Pseudanabaena sp.]
MTKSSKSAEAKPEMTFEEQLHRLEEIVEILDDGEAALDEMLSLYEEGMKRSQFCRDYLEKAEQKVTLIQSQDDF